MKDMLKIIAVSALATAAVIKAVPAFSEPALAQNVAIVQTADLDLSTASGRAALEHRLVTAAYEVCGTASDADLAGKTRYANAGWTCLQRRVRRDSGSPAAADLQLQPFVEAAEALA